jgi:signal transduction histidine kinase
VRGAVGRPALKGSPRIVVSTLAQPPAVSPSRPNRREVLVVVPDRSRVAAFAPVVARALRCRRCSVMLADADGHLVVEESVGLPAGLNGAARVPVGSGVAGRVAEDRRPLLVNDPVERTGWPRPVGIYASESFISYPIELPDGTVGVVNATDREDGGGFGPEDLALLSELATFYASTFDAPARRDVRRLRADLRRERATFIRTQEEERRRLARELHDDAGHTLTAAILRLDMAAQRLIGRGELTEAIDDVRGALVECAEQLHDLAFELQPRLLADLGLAPALRSLARRLREAGAAAHLTIRGEERRLDADAELAAFRIAQEATTNALKHAHASRITLTLVFEEDGIVLEIADDGIGLTSSPCRDGRRDCHGLHGMRERAELVGGVLEIAGRPAEGTTVRARLPEYGA